MPVHKLYDITGGKIKRTKQTCPKCGSGTYLASHKNRLACGKCGYTEYKK